MDTFEHAKTLFLEGLQRLQAKDYAGAAEKLRASLALMPERLSVLNNLAAALLKLREIEEARQLVRKALSIDDSLPEAWLNYGIVHKVTYDYGEAIRCFDRALALNPKYAEAWSNKGACLNQLDRHDGAIECLDKAIGLQPELTEAWQSKVNCLIRAEALEDALHLCESFLSRQPEHAEMWWLKGACLDRLQRKEESLAAMRCALDLDPKLDFALGSYLARRMKLCDWEGFEPTLETILTMIRQDEPATPPFDSLGLLDDPALQRRAAETWVAHHYPATAEPIVGTSADEHERVRIGYFSADYHDHATTYLMAELFELHDRSRFELIALSFGPEKNDTMRQRVAAAFDKFIDVRGLSEVEIARMSRDQGIDIAVDLKGFTLNARPGIFAARAAPLQVGYLGYPGTMGADFIDYLIADPTVIPPGSAQHYSEHIVYLPHSYQVNDRTRRIADESPSRAELGLPESGFVFCCFNNNYKILPHAFNSWMRMLRTVDGSVLWLLETNPTVAANLRREAEQRGIEGERLVFARREPLERHLARQRVADLFLDTHPYNAHTTTSDALWAGLPVITCTGRSFASRVAASLLNAVGLEELVTHDRQSFERLGIELAQDPVRLTGIRERLWRNRDTAPLFDTARFTRDLEAAYLEMNERRRAGRAPAEIVIKA